MAYSVPDPYRQVIRSGGYAITFTVDATLKGSPVAGAQGMVPTGGSITDTTTPGVRRVLNLELAPAPGLFDLLSPIGTTLTVTAHVTQSSQVAWDIPMGVFDVDSEKLSEGGGALSLTAPDKWVRIQRSKFIGPTPSQPDAKVTDQIISLIRAALGSSEPVLVTATSQATVGVLTWEKDRDKAIMDLAESVGAWVYFDRNGLATIADIPEIGGSADWLVDASASGVMIELDRERSRTDTYNLVVVSSSNAGEEFFGPQWVWDNDPNSPTYAGIDPVNYPETAGSFGIVTYFYDTPTPLEPIDAWRVGKKILARASGLASQVSTGQTPNPAVDAGDVLDVLPPPVRYDIPRVNERHIADSVTHPLAVDAAQHIEGRSTRAQDITAGLT